MSDYEYEKLLRERSALINRQFMDGLTMVEAERLDDIRIRLDELESEKYDFDELEKHVEKMESLAQDIKELLKLRGKE